VRIGRSIGTYGEGSIRDVKIFNRELTSTEIAQLARGNDLGFADEFGGAHGGIYTQDATPSGEWTASQGTDADEAGPVGGVSNVLKYTSNTNNAAHYLQLLQFSTGKRHRVEFDYYIPSGQSNIDGIDVDVSGQTSIFKAAAPTLGAWNSVSFECVPTGTAMLILATDGGVRSFQDAGGDDVFYVANCKITEIGTLADFRAERYDTSTSKLYDISDNAFVGTGTSVTLTGLEQPVYEHGTWTPTLSGSTTTDFTYTGQNGYYTRTGDIVFVRGYVAVSALGTSAGDIKIDGLPYTSSSDGNNTSVLNTYVSNMAALSSGVVGLVGDGTTDVALVDTTSTGAASVSIGNLTATSIIRISGTYQIQ